MSPQAPAPAAGCGIAVMAKASRAGLTKTRLAPSIGLHEAARLNTAFLRDAADNLVAASRLAAERGVRLAGYMAYGPPGEGSFFDFLPEDIGLVEAWRDTFGDTLAQAFGGVLRRGHASACLLNADSPTLPPSILAEAAAMLEAPGERLVLGPSTDGGYYLIGARRLHPELFSGIAWSTAVVFEQTLDRAARLGLDVCVLPAWYDVDDPASLAILRGELFEGLAYGPAGPRRGEARHSRAVLEGAGRP